MEKSTAALSKTQIIKIVVIIATIFFEFALLFSFVAAWYSENKEVGGHGMSLSVVTPDVSMCVLTAHPINKPVNGVYTYVEGINDFFALPTFDPSEIIFSEYEKAILLCFEVTASKSFQIEVSCGPWLNQDVANNNVSNCIQIIPATLDGNVINESTTKHSFVSGNIRDDSSVTKNTINLGTFDPEVKKVYFVLEYDMYLIEYFCEKIPITYNDDLSFIVLAGD